MIKQHRYKAIVLGASAGGLQMIKRIVISLPAEFSLPVIVVQHIADTSDGVWAGILNERSNVRVKEADEKEPIKAGTVYLAPSNYHLLVEPDQTFTLTIDERVNHARPSIDVLFETAAQAYGESLIGVICTGGNFDGAKGLLNVKKMGGLTIVQDPKTAEAKAMPQAAIEMAPPDYVLPEEGIIQLLLNIHHDQLRKYESQD